MFFSFSSPANKTNNATNAPHYVKLGKKRRENSKRNCYIISPRVIIKAIIITASSRQFELDPSSSCPTFLCCLFLCFRRFTYLPPGGFGISVGKKYSAHPLFFAI